jgi:DNA-binding transcriptional ArsR family regulator
VKKLLEPYELTRTELEILSELARSPATISKLAEQIGKSPSLVKEAAENLQKKGFTELERQGNKRIIRLSQNKHAQLLRDLILSYPHISWKDILSFSSILPLLKLEDAGTGTLSRTTEWRALRNMMSHGIIIQDDEGSRINPRFQKLKEFIQEFRDYNNSTIAKHASPEAVIVWNKGTEFIIRVPGRTKISDPRFKPTATTAIPEYGIPLISTTKYFLFSPLLRNLRPEDILLHSLLIDGVTNTTYALILMAKKRLDRRYLLKKAEAYKLRDRVEAMLTFLETHQAKANASLPTWDEFAERARDYGVRT